MMKKVAKLAVEKNKSFTLWRWAVSFRICVCVCVLKSMPALLQKSRSFLFSVLDWTSKNRDQSWLVFTFENFNFENWSEHQV